MRTLLHHAFAIPVALTASFWLTSVVAAREDVRSYASPHAYDVTDYEQLAHDEEHQYLQDRQDLLHILLHQKRVSALSRLARQAQEAKKRVAQAYSSTPADPHLQERLAAVEHTYTKKREQVERSLAKEQEQVWADLEQEHQLYHIPD
jgi:hypothetical protein